MTTGNRSGILSTTLRLRPRRFAIAQPVLQCERQRRGTHQPTLLTCLYFASTTYTSLGYGDVIPTGALRLFAGSMALTGLLLIGWTAAYVYISMERFWESDTKKVVA
jgi:hypothetical protein